jgi:catechol 2,3-dioxygenase-like lactoylglutathione lyase family enzyme
LDCRWSSASIQRELLIGAHDTGSAGMEEVGSHLPVHVAFTAGDRRAVDAFHEKALAHGGSDNGAPGVRERYHPNYYAAYVLDPDGNNIEAVCQAE